MDTPRVSVLVASSGLLAPLQACLHRLRAQSVRQNAEIVLVLNAPFSAFTSESLRAIRDLTDQLEFEGTIGKSHALNRGVQVCRGEIIAFTDDDTEPDHNWLEAITAPLLTAHRDGALVGCGGPVLPIFPDTLVPQWYSALIYGRATMFLGPRHYLGSQPCYYGPFGRTKTRGVPMGSNCAYRKELFDTYRYRTDLGPNRKTGLRGGEDWELGLRLLRDGYCLMYRPEAIVRHPVHRDRMTLEYVRRGYFIQGVESIRIARALGQRTPSVYEVRWRVRRSRVRAALGVFGGLPTRLRHELKHECRRGMLAELEGAYDGRSDRENSGGG